MSSRKRHRKSHFTLGSKNQGGLGKMLRRLSQDPSLNLEVDDRVSREISLVVLIVVVVFTFLSQNGNTGTIGQWWYNSLLYLGGTWGIYLFLAVFSLLSVILLFKRDFHMDLARTLGTILFFVSSLGYIGLSVNLENTKSIQELPSGIIGFMTALGLFQLFGNMGAKIILFGTLAIAILLLFQKPFWDMILWFWNRNEEMEEEDDMPLKEKSKKDDFKIKGLQLAAETNKKKNEAAKEKEKTKESGFVIKTPGEKSKKEPASEFKKQPLATKEQHWEFPSLDLLDKGSSEFMIDEELLKTNGQKIKDKLAQFGISVTMKDLNVGPTVMQYTLEPEEGVKLSKITGLKDDLALALAAKSIRIEAPIPGKALVGIEIPNEKRMLVRLRDILESKDFFEVKSTLRFPLGRDVSGKPMMDSLDSMPHVLIAGATGSGKSVAINSLLLSFLYQNSPRDLKMILIDPKRVELESYNLLPHLLTPVITDPEKALNALRWTVAEMIRRYKELQSVKARNRQEFNQKMGEETKMPYIIVVVDELADLMMTNFKKEVELLICRIAQMARAVGIHLVIATQRPSVDVITGLIKANIPARIAFSVVSSIDSRTILDSIGAEDLIGKGDMLYVSSNMSKPTRIQGVFVSSEEIERVTTKVRMTIEPDYDEQITQPTKTPVGDLPPMTQGGNPYNGDSDLSDDQLVEQAIQMIRETGKASASLMQRRLKLGYARAARILDMLEERGVVGPSSGSKPREIYIEHGGNGDDEEE